MQSEMQCAIEEGILVLISYLWVTYTKMGTLWIVVVKTMSCDNLFTLKQPAIGI
jgi:hypothetical protein